jgi:hypothetical protein
VLGGAAVAGDNSGADLSDFQRLNSKGVVEQDSTTPLFYC